MAVTHKVFQTIEPILHREEMSSETCKWPHSFSCRRSLLPGIHCGYEQTNTYFNGQFSGEEWSDSI